MHRNKLAIFPQWGHIDPSWNAHEQIHKLLSRSREFGVNGNTRKRWCFFPQGENGFASLHPGSAQNNLRGPRVGDSCYNIYIFYSARRIYYCLKQHNLVVTDILLNLWFHSRNELRKKLSISQLYSTYQNRTTPCCFIDSISRLRSCWWYLGPRLCW